MWLWSWVDKKVYLPKTTIEKHAQPSKTAAFAVVQYIVGG